jgi:phospholipid/cholesterol/gamma-HCH transport system substrate-binding protein
MSKQANKTVIGIFVVVAIALVVAAVLILGSGKFFKQTFKAVCYFEGSVGGLNLGAPVVFRGVKIGSVTDVILRVESSKMVFTIPVYIEIEPDKFSVTGVRPKQLGANLKSLIDRGLRASLETQSIVTGQMQVGLDFKPDKPAKFAEIKFDPKTPEIPTVPTPMQELTKKIEKIPIDEIFEKLNATIGSINKLVSSPEIVKAIESVSLAVGDVRKLVQNVDNRVGPLASSIEGTVSDYGKLARNADSKIDTLSLGLGDTIKEIQKAVSSIEKTLGEVQSTLAQTKQTLSEDSTLSYEITETLGELQRGARSIRLLADGLKRHPESIIWGK